MCTLPATPFCRMNPPVMPVAESVIGPADTEAEAFSAKNSTIVVSATPPTVVFVISNPSVPLKVTATGPAVRPTDSVPRTER